MHPNHEPNARERTGHPRPVPARYPLVRAFQFVEAISRDLAQQILKIFSAQRLMQLDYNACAPLVAAV